MCQYGVYDQGDNKGTHRTENAHPYATPAPMLLWTVDTEHQRPKTLTRRVTNAHGDSPQSPDTQSGLLTPATIHAQLQTNTAAEKVKNRRPAHQMLSHRSAAAILGVGRRWGRRCPRGVPRGVARACWPWRACGLEWQVAWEVEGVFGQ
jgi:hypothetical protein